MHVAHMNLARLRAPAGDPLVAEFVDNVPRVNALAERSAGFVWRLGDGSARVADDVPFEAMLDDPMIALSLSVWETAKDLRFFVKQTAHGGFLRRREAWFEPMSGPNYVIWPTPIGSQPTVAEGQARLDMLATKGSTDNAYDFAYLTLAE